MKEYIAYCGLDCEKCEARLATIHNDDTLRAKVAKEWSAMNGTEILPEMVYCAGCKIEGQRTYFCEVMCPIRKCAIKEGCENCGMCTKYKGCETVEMITKHSKEAADNLNEGNR